ncbi:MerR family transcriptional regulator [Tengunoibacter tsumagoiensis]|uniref:MerR family transcriptional regulator n=1 Tax=Tengunoibacter tsumagoiensis TaxID=2014871 RepID=A0A402A335_9CHLR|nr:MerR family transcriptional regulator [Tengunoibacter tsumagoiensis]GCE13563.1 MerR family transcriptional regulator [Tengunoibacter tsumagoiensis]
MFKISDFSKLSQVSMRTLRYYDEIGLLKPGQVDTLTGYRYYSMDQLSQLNRILAFKDLGFELAQIFQLMDEELPVEQIRGMLRLKQAELVQRVQVEQERLARVEARLQQIEMEAPSLRHEVTIKKVKTQIVAVSRKLVTQSSQKKQFADETLAFLRQHGVKLAGSYLFIDHESSYSDQEAVLVEIAIPVQSSSVGNIVERSGGRITIRELPAVNTMATLLYRGNPYTLMDAYQSLGRWLQENDYIIMGQSRKVCLHHEGELSSYVTELQFPVEKNDNPGVKPAFTSSREKFERLVTTHQLN